MKIQIKIIIVFFIIIFCFYLSEIYNNINNTILERKYYKNLLQTKEEFQNNNKNKTLKIIDYWWIEFKIKKEKLTKNFLIEDKNHYTLKEKKLENKILKLDYVNYENATITIPKYVKTTPIILPKNNFSIYEDLRKWVRMSPNANLPHEKWITFLEWHSWNNYAGSSKFSYFDNLVTYYDKIDYKTPIYIETEKYKFEYELFKKEIIEPWSKDFYDSNFHHLILMSCYPRNTVNKRALFHAKLINIIKK